jgi:hypothetical protein
MIVDRATGRGAVISPISCILVAKKMILIQILNQVKRFLSVQDQGRPQFRDGGQFWGVTFPSACQSVINDAYKKNCIPEWSEL